RLAEVFEAENGAAEGRLPGGADGRAKEGEVAADQRAGGDAATDNGNRFAPVALGNAAGGGGLHDGAEEALPGELGHVRPGEVGVEHRSVKGDEAGFGEKRAVQGRDVAVADENFRVPAND